MKLLSQQESMYGMVEALISYMRSPMLVWNKYKQYMKEMCIQTKLIADKAAKLSTLIGESASRLNIHQWDHSTSENVIQRQEDGQEF